MTVRPLFLPLLLTFACAHYSQEDGERLQAETYALATRLEAIEVQLQTLAETQARHDEVLARLVADVGDLNLAARRNDADFGVQLETVMQELAHLKGMASTVDERVSTLESATTKTKEEFDLKLEGLASQQPDGGGPPATTSGRDELLKSPKKALDEAAKMIERGAPQEGRKLVRELVFKNEKKPSFRRYEPRAQFLIAESYFAAGSYQQAAAEYNKVRKSYPKSSLVPESYLKLGICFERLGLKGDAKTFYEALIKRFKRSSAAAKARERLRDL